MKLTFRPLDAWPGEARAANERERSRFRTTEAQTKQLLRRELEALGTLAGVVQLDVADREVRADGELRSDFRKPRSPGVVVSWQGADGVWRHMRNDKFDIWHHNLRGIARSLEALRLVERDGALSGEQYEGLRKELPAPQRELGEGFPSSISEAMRFLRDAADLEPDEAQVISFERQYKLAAKYLHPDSGYEWASDNAFATLTRCKDLLIEEGMMRG